MNEETKQTSLVKIPAQRLTDERPTTTCTGCQRVFKEKTKKKTIGRPIKIFGLTKWELSLIALYGWIFASWFTHIIYCLLVEQWGFSHRWRDYGPDCGNSRHRHIIWGLVAK